MVAAAAAEGVCRCNLSEVCRKEVFFVVVTNTPFSYCCYRGGGQKGIFSAVCRQRLKPSGCRKAKSTKGTLLERL
jgi:hypothetical protein